MLPDAVAPGRAYCDTIRAQCVAAGPMAPPIRLQSHKRSWAVSSSTGRAHSGSMGPRMTSQPKHMSACQPRHPNNTSIAGWSLAIARALEAYDVDAGKVFSAADINLEAIVSTDERLPVKGVQQVWRWAEHNTDEYFGIRVAENICPASFQALGYALWSSSTMLEFLQRLIRYRCVISQRFFCDLVEDENQYRFLLVDQRTVKSEITHDTLMSFIVRMGRQLGHAQFSPLWIHCSRPPGYPTQRISEFFGTRIETDTGESTMCLDAEDLHRPLRHGNPELVAELDSIVERYIAKLGLTSEHMLRVRNEIHRLLITGEVSIDQVAENLNVTVRTLQRRLSAEQSTYNHVLDDVRCQLSLEYVQDPTNTVTDVAFRLGFNDSGRFGRSFKRWTGKSFTQYRDSLE
jgi:AraC-like DNA-binding protein